MIGSEAMDKLKEALMINTNLTELDLHCGRQKKVLQMKEQNPQLRNYREWFGTQRSEKNRRSIDGQHIIDKTESFKKA